MASIRKIKITAVISTNDESINPVLYLFFSSLSKKQLDISHMKEPQDLLKRFQFNRICPEFDTHDDDALYVQDFLEIFYSTQLLIFLL